MPLSGPFAVAATAGQAVLLSQRRQLPDPYHLWLDVIDTADPARPRRLGEIDLCPQEVDGGGDIALAGRMAYVVVPHRPDLFLVDIGDPQQPRVTAAAQSSPSPSQAPQGSGMSWGQSASDEAVSMSRSMSSGTGPASWTHALHRLAEVSDVRG